jgi:hypothetical protein
VSAAERVIVRRVTGRLLEAQGFTARPGPAVLALPGVLETIAEALKGPFLLAIAYAGADAPKPSAASRRTACFSACAAIWWRAMRIVTRACAISGSTASGQRGSWARASFASPDSISRRMRPAPSAPVRTRPNMARSSGVSPRKRRRPPATSSSNRPAPRRRGRWRPRRPLPWLGLARDGLAPLPVGRSGRGARSRGSADDGRWPPSERIALRSVKEKVSHREARFIGTPSLPPCQAAGRICAVSTGILPMKSCNSRMSHSPP